MEQDVFSGTRFYSSAVCGATFGLDDVSSMDACYCLPSDDNKDHFFELATPCSN